MKLLISELPVGSLTLKNRLVMPPMATPKNENNGLATDEVCKYYAEKSQGGFLGLVITEHCYVSIEGKAHNGQLSGYKSLETGNFRPVGETDSEKAFCWLLHKLTQRYPRTPGNMTAVFKYIASLASELREKGVFNMLLSDGRYVMAFCSTNLFWITRRAPFGVAKLLDQDVEIDFQRETTPNDVVTVIATQPLTGNETWQKIMPGEWVLFCLGDRVV